MAAHLSRCETHETQLFSRRMLDNTSQPHSMFVDTVRARDEEIRAAGREIERLRQQLIALGGERDHVG